MRFEPPDLKIIRFEAKDVLTASPWDLPEVSGDQTEPTGSNGWETPIYP